MKTTITITFILSCFVLLSLKTQSYDQPTNKIKNLDLRVYGIQINVTSINEALDFYSKKVGFEIKSQTTTNAELQNDGITLLLNKVLKLRKNKFPEETRTHLVLHTNNLDSLITSFKTIGITFIVVKTENGVGYAAMCEDPFGNKISFMEQSKYPVPWFKEPKIYNTGYSMDNLEKAKEFYCDGLDFYVRTTKYLPALPLGHQDSTFAFMLHKKNVRTTTYSTNETQLMIVFSTTNIELLINQLEKRGINTKMVNVFEADTRKSYYLIDPFGNICKIIQKE